MECILRVNEFRDLRRANGYSTLSYLALLFPRNQLCFVIALLHQLESQLFVHLGQLLSQSQHVADLITDKKQEI